MKYFGGLFFISLVLVALYIPGSRATDIPDKITLPDHRWQLDSCVFVCEDGRTKASVYELCVEKPRLSCTATPFCMLPPGGCWPTPEF
ncbi:MAG: hypothetical protein QNK37_03785 [Acidobacteriota bacterium]|nr:hypothetical protein [Acidobacteriota bacterium]